MGMVDRIASRRMDGVLDFCGQNVVQNDAKGLVAATISVAASWDDLCGRLATTF